MFSKTKIIFVMMVVFSSCVQICDSGIGERCGTPGAERVDYFECEEGLFCKADRICVRMVKRGDSCECEGKGELGCVCEDDTFCDDRGEERVCSSYLGEGEKCEIPNRDGEMRVYTCVDKLRCAISETPALCRPSNPLGSRCEKDFECNEFCIDQVCTKRPKTYFEKPNGASCVQDYECLGFRSQEAYCKDSVCTKSTAYFQKTVGTSCVHNYECKGYEKYQSYCKEGVCTKSKNYLEKPLGSSCIHTYECEGAYSPNVCRDGICTKR